MLTVIHYPNCSSCRRAQKWLQANDIAFKLVHITEQTPTASELRKIWQQSELPLKKFFNTSGIKYRELGLKDKLAAMSEDEQLALLASEGMLIKRPIVTNGKSVTLGFNEVTFEQTWK